MRKAFTFILIMFFSIFFAQKMAYVDTQYILKQMPQYQQSEKKLDDQIKKWQKEIMDRRTNLEKLKLSFENEKILLTDEQQKTKNSVIDSLEGNLNKFIEKKFGPKGESTSLRYNLAKPLQDQIWNSINTIASKERYNIIFDKSSDLIMVFTDSKYDITDKVIKQMGLENEIKSKNPKESVQTGNKKNNTKEREDIEREEIIEVDKKEEDKKPKKGYGSRYNPKKAKEKKEKKEQEKVAAELEKAKVKQEESDDTQIETESNKVLKNETKETEIKKQEIDKVKQAKSTESEKSEKKEEVKNQKVKTEEKKPKKGYGSKYVPKKKVTETKTETEQK